MLDESPGRAPNRNPMMEPKKIIEAV